MTLATERLSIRARNLSKRFGDTVALDQFNLDIWESGVITLLGPSGCGKTTALRVIAGFERPDMGSVEVRGRTVVDQSTFVPPEKRAVGMVFQDYALFPHMTVAGNVAYGIPRSEERRGRVAEVLELVGLSGLEERMPHELSGGQQQRVALARALGPKPAVILLDEPFSNLDAALRDRVRRELRVILTEARTTAVFVTHDQEEALAMSDVVAVMREGTVVQADTPARLYATPSDAWVAEFLGDADLVPGTAVSGRVKTVLGTFETELVGAVQVMTRPEELTIEADEHGNAVVANTEFFGHDQLVTVVLQGSFRVRVRIGPRPSFRPGDQVKVGAAEATIFASS